MKRAEGTWELRKRNSCKVKRTFVALGISWYVSKTYGIECFDLCSVSLKYISRYWAHWNKKYPDVRE